MRWLSAVAVFLLVFVLGCGLGVPLISSMVLLHPAALLLIEIAYGSAVGAIAVLVAVHTFQLFD